MYTTIKRMSALILAAPIMLAGLASANMGEQTGTTANDPNFVDGRRAIEAQNWAGAVDAMKKAIAADSKNADAHNWLGFAYRKQGNMDASFASYKEALRLNPGLKAAHEYIGEAYLATKQLAKAEEHLAELAKLCTPIPCEEHKDLKRAIDEFKSKSK